MYLAKMSLAMDTIKTISLIHDAMSPSLKRLLPAESASENTLAAERKKRQNAVNDVLVRQQLLSAIVRAKIVGPTHSDYVLAEHINKCCSTGCLFEECSLARKCLNHFKKCHRQDCIVCVEARLHQVMDKSSNCTEEEKFTFSAWRARLQSVNEETKEYVPYFNSCGKDLLVARSTRSPFLQATKERYQTAQALVAQSEKRYAELCAEIYAKWSQLFNIHDDSASSDSGSGEENSSCDSNGRTEESPDVSALPWHDSTRDKDIRLRILKMIFDWSKQSNPNALLLGDKVLLDGARKAESILYSMSSSLKDYEDQAKQMCQ